MSEMIERVAKAIWKIHSSSFSDGVGLEDDLIYEDMARAAIEAMREPTDAMFGGEYGVLLRRQFTEMVQTALNLQDGSALSRPDGKAKL